MLRFFNFFLNNKLSDILFFDLLTYTFCAILIWFFKIKLTFN